MLLRTAGDVGADAGTDGNGNECLAMVRCGSGAVLCREVVVAGVELAVVVAAADVKDGRVIAVWWPKFEFRIKDRGNSRYPKLSRLTT